MILSRGGEARRLGLPINLPINGHSFRRVEVLSGDERRRRWSAAEKAAIVAESFAPGAVSSAVALRHGLHRNQLYAWRRELRSAVVADTRVPAPEFVPIVAQGHVAAGSAAIEIAIGDMVLRASPGVDLGFLGEIIRVLKATV
jgi:transposase